MQDQLGDDGQDHHIFGFPRWNYLDIGKNGHMVRKALPAVSTGWRLCEIQQMREMR